MLDAQPTAVPKSSIAHELPIGFHRIHPDVSINYQLNRFSDGSPAMVEAMRKVAPKIVDYRDYTRELSALSREAYERGRLLEGALFLRSAQFYMFPGDAAKEPARRQFVSTMRSVYGVAENAYHVVPYQTASLFAYRFTPPSPRGTIVLACGFDGYVEETFPMVMALRDAGYDVVAFEGPGQGSVLEDVHLAMTPEWDRPVAAVLDHFHLAGVTLLGMSLGGCLAVRAAAREPRVTKVVCDDVLADFEAAILQQVPGPKRLVLRGLLAARASSLVNRMMAMAMRESLVIEWGIKQGMLVTGTPSPYDFLREAMRYETASLSGLLTQDVLIMAGAEDHYVPSTQLVDQFRLLTKARSVTARLFTREEQAQNHIQLGNLGLSVDVIVRWLGGIEDRDRRMNRRPVSP
jgi:alpha-beta hydrolase superfamily lysophospholipase